MDLGCEIHGRAGNLTKGTLLRSGRCGHLVIVDSGQFGNQTPNLCTFLENTVGKLLEPLLVGVGLVAGP